MSLVGNSVVEAEADSLAVESAEVVDKMADSAEAAGMKADIRGQTRAGSFAGVGSWELADTAAGPAHTMERVGS